MGGLGAKGYIAPKQARRLLRQRNNAARFFRAAKRWRSNETGVTLIETLIALALLGVIAVAFVGGMAMAAKATFIADEQATAESLVHSELEYVKNCTYQYDVSEYPVNPELTVPEGWVVPPPVVEPLHATDDGIQKITVKAERNGEVVLIIEDYKVDR